jgi:hypothetical protein
VLRGSSIRRQDYFQRVDVVSVPPEFSELCVPADVTVNEAQVVSLAWSLPATGVAIKV